MNDLLIRTLKGESTHRRPVWIMRQAGRYLPEYRALRKDNTFEEMCANPELAAQVTLMPFDRFALDGAIVFADLMSPVPALGCDVRFAPGPVCDNPVRDMDAIKALKRPDAKDIAPTVIETLERVKMGLDGRATLLGFAGAPWSIAAYMVEGQGKKGFPHLRAMALGRPEELHALLSHLTDILIDYVTEQHKAGAQAIQIFDTWAGLLSEEYWSLLVRPHLKRLLEAMGERGIPRILFLQDASHLLEGYLHLPSECLSVDWRLDLAKVRKMVGPERAVQGNLDPALLLGGPEITRTAVQNLLKRVPKQGHIFNLGHGILPNTPIESVKALLDVVHNEGR